MVLGVWHDRTQNRRMHGMCALNVYRGVGKPSSVPRERNEFLLNVASSASGAEMGKILPAPSEVLDRWCFCGLGSQFTCPCWPVKAGWVG